MRIIVILISKLSNECIGLTLISFFSAFESVKMLNLQRWEWLHYGGISGLVDTWYFVG